MGLTMANNSTIAIQGSKSSHVEHGQKGAGTAMINKTLT
jgi:hypothetical protein